MAGAAAALDQGLNDAAAMRIAALYAVGGDAEGASLYAAQLITTQEGREAFALRYAAQGHWQSRAFENLSRVADAEDFAATAIIIARKEGRLECRRAERISERFRREGHPRAAQILGELCAAQS